MRVGLMLNLFRPRNDRVSNGRACWASNCAIGSLECYERYYRKSPCQRPRADSLRFGQSIQSRYHRAAHLECVVSGLSAACNGRPERCAVAPLAADCFLPGRFTVLEGLGPARPAKASKVVACLLPTMSLVLSAPRKNE